LGYAENSKKPDPQIPISLTCILYPHSVYFCGGVHLSVVRTPKTWRQLPPHPEQTWYTGLGGWYFGGVQMGSRSEIFNVASGFYHVWGPKKGYFRCKDPKWQFGLDYKETMLRRTQKMSLFCTFCQFCHFWSLLSTTESQFCNQEVAVLWLQNGHFRQLGNVTFCHFWGARM
jgi:hypothetical protein